MGVMALCQLHHPIGMYKKWFQFDIFENISVLDSCFIHMYRIIKYRSSSIKGKNMPIIMGVIALFQLTVCIMVLYRLKQHSGSVVEHPLCDREVAGSIPGQVIPKTSKMALAALSIGAQH